MGFALQDTDGSETITGDIIITDIPDGASLNVGEAGENNTWVISQDDLNITATNDAGDPIAWEIPDLTLTPAEGASEDFTLGIQVTTQDGDDTNLVEGSIVIDVLDDIGDSEEVEVEEPVIEPEQDSEEVEYENVIKGTDKSDHIDGTDENDDIDGGLKNDNIDGGDGDDRIDGGEGNDQLDGGDGNDTLIGDAGNDQIDGGAGDDILIGGDGNDQIDGGAGDDTFITGDGNDFMDGGDGNDLFTFAADSDGLNVADGGAGDGWLDTVQLTGVEGDPGLGGDWTLETDAEFTIDSDNNTLDFTDGDASGTITMEDGSVLEFDNMENISW
ncbi:MAG: hypothetical protein HQL69_12700 [Magnetococcales bacterium]|nr:hypothetical protein [Magnetococcales bacterium]